MYMYFEITGVIGDVLMIPQWIPFRVTGNKSCETFPHYSMDPVGVTENQQFKTFPDYSMDSLQSDRKSAMQDISC